MIPAKTRQEQGFTLIELLVSVSVMGAIMAAITAAFIGFLQTGAKTSARDDHSAGGALLASYLDRDLASADTHSASGSPCTVANPAPGAQFRLSWTEAAVHADPSVLVVVPGGTWHATYALILETPASPSSLRRLVRQHCTPTGTSTTTLLSGLPPSTLLTFSTAGTCTTAGSTKVVVSLPSYSDDATEPYRYGGCVRGRIR